ncbi:MAG TPA: hypothetical protein VHO28_14160, partial [Ignavibacteriales bacterium]|nr:hypothetical protein [Ignavibacteriales bacterium]
TIDSMLIIGSSLAILKPSFKIYKNKLLLDSVNYYMDYNILTIDFQFKYKEIERYIIPEIIFIEEKWKGGKMKIQAALTNIILNKK